MRITIELPYKLGGSIDVRADYDIECSGIGAYEFWGQKGFDKGEEYAFINDIEPIFTTQSPELIAAIKKYIDDNEEAIYEYVADQVYREYKDQHDDSYLN